VPAPGGRTGGSAWRRDRVVVVAGLIALAAIAIGVMQGLSTPAQSTGPDAAVELSDIDDLRDAAGSRVVAEDVEVESVPADEGFWVETGGGRTWVQVDTAGESPFLVEEGRRVSFTGTVMAHGPEFAQRPGFSGADADDLADAGAHVEVDVDEVRLSG
jgi:hypothetical protein